MVVRVVDELGGIATVGLLGDLGRYGPTGESPSAFVDIVFCVVELSVRAYTQGEEL